MINVNFSKREFSKLKKLELENSILNTEAQLFLLENNKNHKLDGKLLKYFYNTTGTYFSNKLYITNELIYKKGIIDIPEIVMPDYLMSIDNEICGYVMPYIKSDNLGVILMDNKVPLTKKVEYLKRVGKLLEKIKNVRKYTTVNDIYLNDLHEGNFIVGKEDKKLYLVDSDSIKIGTSIPVVAKYLTPFSKINEVAKYQKYFDGEEYLIEPDQNTEIYSYIVMIFNLFYGDNISNLSIAEYYSYLEYLADIGVPIEFLDIMGYIYTGHENVNPGEYLEEIEPFYGRTNKNVYERVKN